MPSEPAPPAGPVALPPVTEPTHARQEVPVGPAAAPGGTLTLLALILTTVAALWLGRDLLVPLALAILLSFALGPLVRLLQRIRLGRVPSVLLAVALAAAVLGGVGTVVTNQLIQLAEDLPRYEQNIRAKIRDLKSTAPGGGLVERTTDVLKDIGDEIADTPSGAPDEPAAGAGTDGPVLVRVEPPPTEPLALLRDFAGPVLGPIGTAGIVLVFVVFILLQREDLRDRLIRLAGSRDLRRTTVALNEAGTRVSRYLLTHLVLNLMYGIPIGLGLWAIGVPNPLLWGLLAVVLRFIPYLGPVVAAVFPIALSFAVDPGWTLPLLTVGLFLGVELFSNNVLEPWWYGASTGLSSFAVILAAIFWTTLWGPVGLLLATPLTVCLAVLGRHVPQLEFLDVLLGNRPALPPAARIYQRLLARDPEAAARIAEEEEAAVPGVALVYQDLVIPALQLAERDRQRGVLDDPGQRMVLDGVERLVDWFADADHGADDAAGEPAVDAAPSPGTGRILCIGARSDLDEAAALLVVDLLSARGIDAVALPCETVGVRRLPRLGRDGVGAVLVSYLDAGTGRHAQRMLRRLRRHFGPGVAVIVAAWGRDTEIEDVGPCATDIPTAVALLAKAVGRPVERPGVPTGPPPPASGG